MRNVILQKALALVPNVNAVTNEVSGVVIGKAELIKVIWLGIVTGHPAFVLGHYGVAKTMIIREMLARIDGARFFEQLVPALKSASEIFVGARQIVEQSLGEGRKSIAVIEEPGGAAEAHFVYFDEFFKEPDNPALNHLINFLLNGMLIINGKLVRSPLVFAIAAGNEIPDPKGKLGAVYARLAFRYVSESMTETERSLAIDVVQKHQHDLVLGVNGRAVNAVLTLDDIALLRQAYDLVEIPSDIKSKMEEIRRTLASQTGQDFSTILLDDRRCVDYTLNAMQANALLEGRTMLSQADLSVLSYLWWERPEQIPVLKSVLAPYIRTALTEATELVRQLLADGGNLKRAMSGDVSVGVAAGNDIKEAKKEITRLIGEAGANNAMADAIRALETEVNTAAAAMLANFMR